MTANKKKIYIAILVVGMAALGIDQLLRSEPAPAAAQSPAAATQTPRSAAGSRPATASKSPAPKPKRDQAGDYDEVAVTVAPFPQPLSTAPPQDASWRDMFMLSPLAQEALFGPLEPPQEEEVEPVLPDKTTAAEFALRHRLVAVMASGQTSVAIVDEKWLRPGEVLDDCMLTKITGRSVWFECFDGPVELNIATYGSSPPD